MIHRIALRHAKATVMMQLHLHGRHPSRSAFVVGKTIVVICAVRDDVLNAGRDVRSAGVVQGVMQSFMTY